VSEACDHPARRVVHKKEIPLEGGRAHLDIHVWSDGVITFWLSANGVTTAWHAGEQDSENLVAEMVRGLSMARKSRGER
jgi:hypothetical protein